MAKHFSILKEHIPAKVLVLSVTAFVFLLYIQSKFLLTGYSFSDGLLLYALLATSLALHCITFQIPPRGQTQSMDSSIYLACIFVYNDSISLAMVMLNTVLSMVYDRSTIWWKQLINMAIFAIIIKASSLAFSLSGGIQGGLMNGQIVSYFIALLVYFIGNTLFVSFYYLIIRNHSPRSLIPLLLKDSLLVYACTMILSLVLTVLLVHNGIIGLLLFAATAIMLSYFFRKIFKLYGQVQKQVNIDLRTGLYNHSYFEDLLNCHFQNAKHAGSPLVLALLDIDDFKRYNEHYGHMKGDQLIQHVGEFLKRECEAIDAITLIASRYGGDEFTLLMSHYDLPRANQAVNLLRKKINDTYFEGVEIFPLGCLSFSAGIAMYSEDIHDKSLLVDYADQALSNAKRQGKNIAVTFGNQYQNQLVEEMDITQDIRDIEQQLNLFLYKDINTFKHSKRVFRYAMDMSTILKLDMPSKRQFVLGALIHDIGKLEVPRDMLNKKEKLTKEEWNVVKEHVIWGKRIVLSSEKFKDLAPYIELHHERFDGKGYPHGFKGTEIPRLCRVLSIIDSFDAMTSERPYQRTKSIQEGLIELKACAGSQFDPELTDLFIHYIEGKYNDQLQSSSSEMISHRLEADKKRYPSAIPIRG